MNKVILLIVITASAFLLQSVGGISYSANKSEQLDSQPKLEGKKDSCETYIDLSKLIISLSTGVFVLVPAFFKIIGKKVPKCKGALFYGLISLGLSIVAGLFAISALAGTQRIGEYNIAAPHIKYTSMVQWIAFLLGLSLCGRFILQNIFEPKSSETETDTQKEEKEQDEQ